MGFFDVYYALGLPPLLTIIIVVYLLFTGSGVKFNLGGFLDEISPDLWASFGLCIWFSAMAGWYIFVTGSSTLGGVDYSDCSTAVLKHHASSFLPDLRKGLGRSFGLTITGSGCVSTSEDIILLECIQ